MPKDYAPRPFDGRTDRGLAVAPTRRAPLEWLSCEQAQGFWESPASEDYAGEVATVKRLNIRSARFNIRNGQDRLVLADTD